MTSSSHVYAGIFVILIVVFSVTKKWIDLLSLHRTFIRRKATYLVIIDNILTD